MISQSEMQKQVIAYALEAARNQALEEAATLVEQMGTWPLWMASQKIRELKRDPSLKITDWWAAEVEPINFVPIGA
jgi:hypothetical protein